MNKNKIILRAIEPEDLEFLYQIENNEDFWEISNTQAPFSKFILRQYLENAHLDIYEAKQLRLIIEEDKEAIGMIDLFDFNPKNKRAGLGVLITPKHQGKGKGKIVIEKIKKYAFDFLDIHQLYVNISIDNTKSISLFRNQNFKQVGVKKDWIYSKGKYKDEILFQYINEKDSNN